MKRGKYVKHHNKTKKQNEIKLMSYIKKIKDGIWINIRK
jgi:hypothetical protein